jgi:hypothetical protein
MSVKLCFYCKAHVTAVRKFDGTVIYTSEPPTPPQAPRDPVVSIDATDDRE